MEIGCSGKGECSGEVGTTAGDAARAGKVAVERRREREEKAAEATRGQTEEVEQIKGVVMTRGEEEEEVEEWSDMEGVERGGLCVPRHAAATKTE